MPEHPCYDPGERTERRWRIPPPLTENPSVPGPQGSVALRDFPGEVGEVLWIALRSVHLWATVEREERGDLFPAGGLERWTVRVASLDLEGGAADRLRTVLSVLDDPVGADASAVADACSRLAYWAEERDAPETGLALYQAAALSCPADPGHALRVARAHRDRAQYTKAGSWLHRAVGLARQRDDWESYAQAYICLGKMAVQRGAYPEARKYLIKALRRSVREGLKEQRAAALHDLHVVESNTGQWHKAHEYARKALQAYGSGHRELPALAHDIACQMAEHGFFREAYPVFRAVHPKLDRRRQPYTLGSIARAAGALGDEEAWREARDDLASRPEGPGVAGAWVEVGQGGSSLGFRDDAREAAEKGLRMARDRGEGKVVLDAERVLETIEAERKAGASTDRAPDRPSEAEEFLSREILSSLDTVQS